MISPTLEKIALVEHFISLFGDLLTFYFNSNSEILFLCIINAGQHILKIYRIIASGFALEHASLLSCCFHAFFNNFTMNASLAAACLLIFTLYAAMVHPLGFSKHYKRLRPYIYAFVIIYTAVYTLIGLYEPIFIGYSPEFIAQQSNCSSGYRTKMYQYIFGSPVFNLPFTLPTLFCSAVIIYKIIVVPRKFIKKQITTKTKMSFTRWVKILFYTVFLALISFINLYSDIKNGIDASNGVRKETENLGKTYFLTASSGILIFLFTNSRNQIKRKFGIKVKNDDSINDDTEYILPKSNEDISTSNSSFVKRSNNNIFSEEINVN